MREATRSFCSFFFYPTLYLKDHTHSYLSHPNRNDSQWRNEYTQAPLFPAQSAAYFTVQKEESSKYNI